MRIKKAFVLTTTLLLAMISVGSAQVIGVDFNNDSTAANCDVNDPGNGVSPTFKDKGVLGESFIGVSSAGTGITLSDGVTMDITSTGAPPAFRDQWSPGANDLFRDFVQADPGQTLTITLHGLKPKAAYKLVGYAASTRSGKDATTFSGALTGTAVGSVDGQAVSRNSFVLNQNYVQGTASADANGSLAFTISGTEGNWAVLNGFGIALATSAPAAATATVPATKSGP